MPLPATLAMLNASTPNDVSATMNLPQEKMSFSVRNTVRGEPVEPQNALRQAQGERFHRPTWESAHDR